MEISPVELPMANFLKAFRQWWAEALAYTMGNSSETKKHLPPAVGVQPYRDTPPKQGH
ncbi:MAG: hypothetical protein RLZZ158_501 [Cyanobacteriota bacterium]|jgi:hypothetical protein